MYGVIDFSRIDTNPGAASAFAPPKEGTMDYQAMMRDRWMKDPGVKQHILMVAGRVRKGVKTEFMGPYADKAEAIVAQVEKAPKALGNRDNPAPK